jgi:Arc/MetJ-type ribon-helix-helix transcriptional regulator
MHMRQKGKDVMPVNFKLNRHVIEVLDQLVQTGLYKSRIDIVLAALRNYEPFKIKWKELEFSSQIIHE